MAPGRVTAVEADACEVDVSGRPERASTLLLGSEVHIGDWVLLNGGAVVRSLPPEQAEAMREALSLASGDPSPSPTALEHEP